jgi:hypothetical protein
MTSHHEEIKKLEKLAEWMDSKFLIPGTDIRFGLDSLVGLIPGVGDTVTLASTIYIISKAQKFGLPLHITLLMIWNAFVDWLIGLVPFAGDIFDIGWKANRRNVALIRKHARSHIVDEIV